LTSRLTQLYRQVDKVPAPMVTMKVSAPDSPRGKPVDAMVDSGAYMSVIPEGIAEEFKLVSLTTVDVKPYDEKEPKKKKAYFVDIEILGVLFPYVKVVLTPWSIGLIGRDLLKSFIVMLDGPKQQLGMEAPKRPGLEAASPPE